MRLHLRAAALLVAGALAAAGAARGAEPELHFLRSGKPVRTLTLSQLTAGCKVQVVAVHDPLTDGEAHFRACPMAAVLALGFGTLPKGFTWKEVLLRAQDGYLRGVDGGRLQEAGGFLAFADAGDAAAAASSPGFAPRGPRAIDPGPFYLVWTGASQSAAAGYPWPYQLVSIDIADFEKRFPHTVPLSAAVGGPVWRGYALFKARCAACHPINGEGGKVGPELNVPRNILEYRSERQLRAFIRDPDSFRYTSMPPNPDLSDSDMDALIAYLRTMGHLKHDPGSPRAE